MNLLSVGDLPPRCARTSPLCTRICGGLAGTSSFQSLSGYQWSVLWFGLAAFCLDVVFEQVATGRSMTELLSCTGRRIIIHHETDNEADGSCDQQYSKAIVMHLY